MNRKFLTLMILSTLAAFSAFAQDEKLLGFMANTKGMTFQVASGGCTSKASFRIDYLKSLPVQIMLVRTVEDFCEAYLPYGTELEFSWDELGLTKGEEFVLANPINREMRVIKFD